jgi:hypothetical protein
MNGPGVAAGPSSFETAALRPPQSLTQKVFRLFRVWRGVG